MKIHNKNTRAAVAVFAAIIMLAAASLGAAALDEPVMEHAPVAYLYNLENDKVIFEYHKDDVIYPASTVKIMTGLVCCESLADRLDEKVTVGAEMLKNVTGNNIGLTAGEIITVRDLLYATLVGGANDSAYVLAFTVSGSVDGFVKLMNDRAVSLGATYTRYKNPSGMHEDDMVTTAGDTAKIALAAYKNALYMQIVDTARYTIEGDGLSYTRNVYNRNYLVAKNKETKYYYPYAHGLNAGSTKQGGYCVVTVAQQENLSYLCVVMGAEYDEASDTAYSYIEARKLLDFAFDGYGYITVLDAKKTVCEIPVTLSDKADYVTLMPEKELSVYLPRDTDVANGLTLSHKITSESLEAPVYEGQVAGFITVSMGDTILGTVNLVTKNGVERSEFLYVLDNIKRFSRSRFFIATVIAVVVVSVIYVLGKAIYRYRKKNDRLKFR